MIMFQCSRLCTSPRVLFWNAVSSFGQFICPLFAIRRNDMVNFPIISRLSYLTSFSYSMSFKGYLIFSLIKISDRNIPWSASLYFLFENLFIDLHLLRSPLESFFLQVPKKLPFFCAITASSWKSGNESITCFWDHRNLIFELSSLLYGDQGMNFLRTFVEVLLWWAWFSTLRRILNTHISYLVILDLDAYRSLNGNCPEL